jgi:hypothetical protein
MAQLNDHCSWDLAAGPLFIQVQDDPSIQSSCPHGESLGLLEEILKRNSFKYVPK